MYRDLSLETAGIEDRSRWMVSTIGSFAPIGLAVHEPSLLDVLRASPKALWGLRSSGVLKDVPIAEVNPAIVHRFVVWFERNWGGELKSETALVQVGSDLSEVEFWLERVGLRR